MQLDAFLPVYDIEDGVAVVADAPADACWDALLDADLIEVGRRYPAVGVLGALRMLPETVLRLSRGQGLPAMPDSLRLRDMPDRPPDEGGWILLREDPEAHELVLGLVGRFWRPVIPYAHVAPGDFAAFDQPGWAKTVYALSVKPLEDGRSLLVGTMRTATTDEAARRAFARYWTLGVGSGAHVLVRALLQRVRDAAQEAVPA